MFTKVHGNIVLKLLLCWYEQRNHIYGNQFNHCAHICCNLV